MPLKRSLGDANFFMDRYSEILTGRKREIVLLRGKGCVYKKCAFCDYHLDKCADEEENFALNKSVLDSVTGRFSDLEVINSGSVFELDKNTIEYIKKLCVSKGIKTLHFESHYLYRSRIEKLREFFDGIELKMKLGLETFDYDLRERVLLKGIDEKDPKKICRGFDEANFLFGIDGQTAQSMLYDVDNGLKYLERICVNIMCENSTPIKPNKSVIDAFLTEVYPTIKENGRVDVLINNTDFGVGD